MSRLSDLAPWLSWMRSYDRSILVSDGLAALIVTVMLIPQSLAYAMLAGLPPEAGLYASILPIVAYALFGTSRALAVGPVAVVSLMTLSAAGEIGQPGSPEFIAAALVLALLSGLILLAMGVLRLGFLANLLAHPVVTGFITASCLIIAISQMGALLGVRAQGETPPEQALALVRALPSVHLPTAVIGGSALIFLLWVRRGARPLLVRLGLARRPAELLARTGPILAVIASTLAVSLLALDHAGVKVVGDIPRGLPPLTLPVFDPTLWSQLFVPALLISIIGFVESLSVAQTLAARRRQRIRPDQELIGLGAANLAAAFTGGYPVTGGFARSVVNFDAGAETPAAGAFTAVGILLAALFLTPLLANLPIAALAATIIVAVLSLIDVGSLRRLWRFSKTDFAAMAVTLMSTLILGVGTGVVIGVLASLGLLLWRTSRPHAAVVGRIPGTEHFRNVKRHQVVTDPRILTVRIDEGLNYLNARWLEEFILEEVAEHPKLRHLVLMCSAVNGVDASALESLETINHRLGDGGIRLHLSEVKGPVMDALKRSDFLSGLTGRVFLSQNEAFSALVTLAEDGEAPPLKDDLWLARGLI